MNVRRADKGDLPILKELVAELLSHERPIRPTRRDVEQVDNAYFEEMLGREAADDGGILIAEREGSVLGFLAYACDVDDLEVDEKQYDVTEIVVFDGARRAGVAKALMEELLHRANASSVRRIVLTVLEGNTEALGFYRSMGFRHMASVLELPNDA